MRFRWNEAAWRGAHAAWQELRCVLRSKLLALRSLPSALRATRGSALVLVLVMITFITLIVAALLLGELMQLRLARNAQHELQALHLAEAGIHKTMWLLAGNEGKDISWRTGNESMAVFENQTAQITITEWGGFLRVTATARAHRDQRTIRVLLGEKPPLAFQRAIHVGGADYPLVVTGKNRILGDVTVGAQGVRAGRLKGREFEGEHLVEGRIFRERNPTMPEYDAGLPEKAMTEYRRILAAQNGERIFHDVVFQRAADLMRARGHTLHVEGHAQIQIDSTVQGPLRLSCSGDLHITGRSHLHGEIELLAHGRIVVEENARLRDCILFGERGIEVSGEAQVAGQLLSSREIVLKDEARLDYPSLAYVRGDSAEEQWRGEIVLQDRASLRGTIILPAPRAHGSGQNNLLVRLLPQSKVIGAVYSAQRTQHQGAVYGSIVTGQFWLYEEPTIYLNWLQDALTDRTKLPEEFLLPLQFSVRPQLGILSWDEL